MSTSTTSWEVATDAQKQQLAAIEARIGSGEEDGPDVYTLSELRGRLGLGKTAVRISIPTALRSFTDGERCVEVVAEPPTVGAALIALSNQYPEITPRILGNEGSTPRHINVFVGDQDIRSLEGRYTPVSTGEQISIIPAVAGG